MARQHGAAVGPANEPPQRNVCGPGGAAKGPGEPRGPVSPRATIEQGKEV